VHKNHQRTKKCTGVAGRAFPNGLVSGRNPVISIVIPLKKYMTKEYHHSSAGKGWWQSGDGDRMPITDVQLFFYDGRISGSGIDADGVFALKGTWLEGGHLNIRKHYGILPGADMVGEYDGEGTMFGTWQSDDDKSGSWAIVMTGKIMPTDDSVIGDAIRRTQVNALKYRFPNFDIKHKDENAG
jgi:hypothetical protein